MWRHARRQQRLHQQQGQHQIEGANHVNASYPVHQHDQARPHHQPHRFQGEQHHRGGLQNHFRPQNRPQPYGRPPRARFHQPRLHQQERPQWQRLPPPRHHQNGPQMRHEQPRNQFQPQQNDQYRQEQHFQQHFEQQQQQFSSESWHRPWFNFDLSLQQRVLSDLTQRARDSKSNDDLEQLQQQREKVQRLETDLRTIYFRNHPEEESKWLPVLALESSNSSAWCEICDEGFASLAMLKEHENNEHEVCGLEGCGFVANKAVLEEHIIAIHASGLYSRIKNADSPEDIQKWRDERKCNWPSAARVSASQEKERARMERQRMKSDRRRQEMVEREEFFKRQREEEQNTKKITNQSNNDRNAVDKSSTEDQSKRKGGRRQRNKNNKGVKRDVNEERDEDAPLLNIPMFNGLKKSCLDERIEQLPTRNIPSTTEYFVEENDSDNGPPEEVSVVRHSSNETNEKETLNGCSVELERSWTPKNREVNGKNLNETAENERDERTEATKGEFNKTKTAGEENEVVSLHKRQSNENTKSEENSRKTSNIGSNKGSKSVSNQSSNNNASNNKRELHVWNPSDPFVAKIPRRSSRAKNALLENLLAKDIEKERVQLLQCIKYVVANNFFDK